MEKTILGTNKAGLHQLQKNNGYLIAGFIGAIGLISLYVGSVFVGLVFLAGAGAMGYAINKVKL